MGNVVAGQAPVQPRKPFPNQVGMTFNDMVELFHGRLNPTVAFMQGKMKIDGDMGLAMKLAQVV